MPLSDERNTAPLAAPDEPAPAAFPVAPVPAVADGKEHRLDPNVILVQRLSGGVVVVVLGLLSLIVTVVLLLADGIPDGWTWLPPIAWLVLIGALGTLVVIWPKVAYRHTTYSLSPEGLHIRRGVLWRSVTSVPRSRVQHTDVSQGPLERAFGLATLIVYTAGTQHASIGLGGLEHARALVMRDFLIEVAGDDDAV